MQSMQVSLLGQRTGPERIEMVLGEELERSTIAHYCSSNNFFEALEPFSYENLLIKVLNILFGTHFFRFHTFLYFFLWGKVL